MNKTITSILLAVLLSLLIGIYAGFSAGRHTANRYYFMMQSYPGALAVIRCDQVTGEVELIVQEEGRSKTFKLK